MLSNAQKPILGFAAWSGSGKTTLIEKLIPMLASRGFRIALIKHSHHKFDIDTPGKDSFRLRKAGAAQTVVASKRRMALMVDYENLIDSGTSEDASLNDLLKWLRQDEVDLILVEGFRHEPALPKIELHRIATKKPFLFPDDPSIKAIACDSLIENSGDLPSMDINDAESVTNFIVDYLMV